MDPPSAARSPVPSLALRAAPMGGPEPSRGGHAANVLCHARYARHIDPVLPLFLDATENPFIPIEKGLSGLIRRFPV